ncbi:transposase [Blastococcus sp. TF02A-26]|uniref:transposase n=1 Tax=Blastococcus sp. TF02A-26 TaxID=2250577 RepID=UPI0013140ACA
MSDELWTTFETVVPRQEVPLHGRTGRPRTPDRQVLEGIAYVLTTGIAWTKVPEDLGCSGWTCWRRMHEWEKLGVFIQLHQSLVEKFGEQGEREWSRAGLDALMRRMGPAGRSGSPSHAA